MPRFVKVNLPSGVCQYHDVEDNSVYVLDCIVNSIEVLEADICEECGDIIEDGVDGEGRCDDCALLEDEEEECDYCEDCGEEVEIGETLCWCCEEEQWEDEDDEWEDPNDYNLGNLG